MKGSAFSLHLFCHARKELAGIIWCPCDPFTAAGLRSAPWTPAANKDLGQTHLVGSTMLERQEQHPLGAALLLLAPGCSENLPSFAGPSLEAPGSA